MKNALVRMLENILEKNLSNGIEKQIKISIEEFSAKSIKFELVNKITSYSVRCVGKGTAWIVIDIEKRVNKGFKENEGMLSDEESLKPILEEWLSGYVLEVDKRAIEINSNEALDFNVESFPVGKIEEGKYIVFKSGEIEKELVVKMMGEVNVMFRELHEDKEITILSTSNVIQQDSMDCIEYLKFLFRVIYKGNRYLIIIRITSEGLHVRVSLTTPITEEKLEVIEKNNPLSIVAVLRECYMMNELTLMLSPERFGLGASVFSKELSKRIREGTELKSNVSVRYTYSKRRILEENKISEAKGVTTIPRRTVEGIFESYEKNELVLDYFEVDDSKMVVAFEGLYLNMYFGVSENAEKRHFFNACSVFEYKLN